MLDSFEKALFVFSSEMWEDYFSSIFDLVQCAVAMCTL